MIFVSKVMIIVIGNTCDNSVLCVHVSSLSVMLSSGFIVDTNYFSNNRPMASLMSDGSI